MTTTTDPPELYAVLPLDSDAICADPAAAREMAAELATEDDPSYQAYRLVPLAPATWELPAEPGPEVVAVDDGHGCRWERDVPGHWRLVRQAPAAWHPTGWCVKPWRSLLSDHGPLSAAPPEPEVRDA
jgi:hypothetical protein